MKDNGTNEMPWYMNIFNEDAFKNFTKKHEKRDYKSIEHVIDNARFFMESTHELAYDHGYSDGQIEILDKIRAEILNDWQIKEAPNSPFSCGLRYVVEIIDKYKSESE